MYVSFNPNPKGYYTGDCVIRGISKLIDKTWDEVYMDLSVQGFAMKDMPSANHVWDSYLKHNGFSVHTIPDICPDCYTVKDFCDDNPKGKYLLATGSHVIAVENGNYYDSWDSGNEIPILFYKLKE